MLMRFLRGRAIVSSIGMTLIPLYDRLYYIISQSLLL